jgi:hypothetical protein
VRPSLLRPLKNRAHLATIPAEDAALSPRGISPKSAPEL